MSLRFIYGRSGSGKTRFCLDEIKSKINEGSTKPLILLVPEQFTFQAERDLITVLETGGILKTEVLSFRRLAFRVFNEVGGITYPHIHSAGKCMIIYRILDKMRDNFKVFSRSAERQGFVSTLSDMITEFKRYDVTPEALERAYKSLEESNPLKDKLKELHSVYAAFETTLAERYRNSDDDLTLAAEKLMLTSLYDGAEIFIDEFAGFTPQEVKVVERLMLKAERVNITLCTDCLGGDLPSDYNDVFASVKAAYRKFAKIAKANEIKIEPAVHLGDTPLPRFRKSPELSHLECYLSAYPYKAYKEKTGNLSLFSSVNMFSEIEAAAGDILRLCRDKGLRYRDIAVVTRNLADYEKLIEIIFAEYGIPCFLDRKEEISNNPLIRLIISMLDIFNDNWSYDSVFRYLKTGMTGIDQGSIDRLENYVLACGIRASRWTDEQDWRMSPNLFPDRKNLEDQKILLEDINHIRALVSAPLLEFRKKTRGRKKASEFCTALYDFLCSLGIHERIENTIESFKSSGNLRLAGEYSRVWNILMEVFDQTVEVMGDETFGIERFANILKIGFGEYKIGLIPASLDQVLVGSVERSKSHEIKALYVLGANDGIFPSSSAEEGILSDQDRAVLNNAGVELANDTRTQAFDEQFLVYKALTTAGNYLRISWPIADKDGKALRPSMVISRLRKLFPLISETSNIVPPGTEDEEMQFISSKAAAFNHMVSAMRQKVDGKDVKVVWQHVYNWFASQKEWKERLQSVRSSFLYSNSAQQVSGEKVSALYGEPATYSVSRLESFSSCPFAFYVRYGLKAQERKVFRLSPPDVGTFMHSVIEKFSRMVCEGEISWRNFDREWCAAKVSEIVDEMLYKMQGLGVSSSKRYTTFIIRLKRVITRAVWLIAEHIRRSGFDPIDYEIGFGDREKYPPIMIELDSGEKICLTGRIDRVDALRTEEGTYLRIVDYKSGSKSFKLSDVYYGLQIQLLTYLDALWESGSKDEKPIHPGGMLYFKVDDPIIRGNGKISEEEIELAIMKQLKMRGLLLADVKLIKEMDKTIEGSSLIIPATINKGDVLGKNTSAATMEQFILLRKYLKRLLKNLCNEILRGNVSIKPYKKQGITSCTYCSFLSVCQFDTGMKGNSYKLLHDKDNEHVWDLIRGDGETDG